MDRLPKKEATKKAKKAIKEKRVHCLLTLSV
jgi:hypothetical protein